MVNPLTDSVSNKSIVLASGSRIRRHLLQAAGVPFTVAPADLDEVALRVAFRKDHGKDDPKAIALMLATEKAKSIAGNFSDCIVIGCDQTLWFDDRLLHKSKDMETARATLASMRGRTHRLYSAVAFVENGTTIWSTITHADLRMREFSDDFLDEYLAVQGETAFESVGGYQLEGPGIQLFERIDGDYFTILGLPLLEVIDALRQQKVLMS